MNDEQWRPVSKFPHYEVSSYGRVRRTVSRTCGKAGQIINGHVGVHGYRYFNATLDGKRVVLKFHRLVCEAFHGAAPSAVHVVAHNDGNGLNNMSDNLRWATAKENHNDRYQHGTEPVGSKNPRSKLTEKLAGKIRDLYKSGKWTTYQLARQFNVSPTTIQSLIAGRTWRHVA